MSREPILTRVAGGGDDNGSTQSGLRKPASDLAVGGLEVPSPSARAYLRRPRRPARYAAAKPRRERDIQREILRLLHAHGVVAYPMNRERAGRQRANHIGVKGLPDIGGWVARWIARGALDNPMPPKLTYAAPLYIEVKRPGEKLRPEQAAFIKRASEAGCEAFMATSPADVAEYFCWEYQR